MKSKCIYGVLLLPLLLLAGCPQLDLDGPTPPLEIWQDITWPATASTAAFSTSTEVRVLDIDPGEEVIVYLKDPATDVQIPGDYSVTSGSIRVRRDDVDFAISGLPGGMGIVTFANRQKTKEAQLHVFVRNWKKSDVFRHRLDPDPVNYRFTPDREVSENFNPANWRENSYAIYKLIVDRGFHYEAPDGNSNRAGLVHGDRSNPNWFRGLHNEPHILYYPQGEYPYNPADNDPAWKEPFMRKPVFAFALHYESDGDMVGGFPDRQRLELKTMDATTPPAPYNQGPGDLMYSLGGGETFSHRWKFMLPQEFKVSAEYTHIHQIKPEGADNSQPTITLTARRLSTGNEVMQLIYRGPIREMIGDREVGSVNVYLAQVPLEPFRGEWVRAEETVTYDYPGAYRIKVVRIRDMRVLIEYEFNPEIYDEEDPFVMFRKGNTYIRKKTGYYRRIMHVSALGVPDPDNMIQMYRDEGHETRLFIADLEMDKWKD